MRLLLIPFFQFWLVQAFCQKGPGLVSKKWFCQLEIQNRTIDFWLEQKATKIFPPEFRIVNGKETIELNNNTLEGDSVVCPISIFDAVLKFPYKASENFSGRYRKNDTKTPGYYLDFKAVEKTGHENSKSIPSTSGNWTTKWKIEFLENSLPTDTGFGIFTQEKDSIFGSILSETGDYRYLNGKVTGSKAYLQTFDGAHTYLFEMDLTGNQFKGNFIFSKTGSQAIRGTKTGTNPLSDGSTKSKAKQDQKFSFLAKDLEGKTMDQNFEKIKGKALVVQLWGSWCPNCLDETIFMNQEYAKRPQNVEFVGLAFERKSDFEYAKSRVENTRKRLNIQYPVFIGGFANKDSASKVIPSISGVSAFPTTIFVRPDGSVFKVHTGFSGPATGPYFEAWKKEFAALISEISKP